MFQATVRTADDFFAFIPQTAKLFKSLSEDTPNVWVAFLVALFPDNTTVIACSEAVASDDVRITDAIEVTGWSVA